MDRPFLILNSRPLRPYTLRSVSFPSDHETFKVSILFFFFPRWNGRELKWGRNVDRPPHLGLDDVMKRRSSVLVFFYGSFRRPRGTKVWGPKGRQKERGEDRGDRDLQCRV